MEENSLTPGDLFAILNRRKAALILPFLFCTAVALLAAFLLPPVYKSTSTILIEQREIPAEYVTSSITTFAEQRIQSINQRILTSSRLQELIQQFDLYPELKEKKTADEIIEKMRGDISLEPVNVEIADRLSGRTGTATIAFTLSYEGENPVKVQRVVGTITSLFLEEDIKVRTEQSSSAYDFILIEKEKVQSQIDDLEKQLAVFKEQNMETLPELLQLNQQTLNNTERDLEQNKEVLRSLREKREELEEELFNTAVYMEDTELQREMKHQDEQRLELLKIELINLKTKFSDLYPDVVKLNREIQGLTQKVAQSEKEETEKLKNPAYITLSSRLAGLKSDIESTTNQIREMEKRADDYRLKLAATPGVEEKYNTLMAERNNLYVKNTELQAKMMEAKIAREFESKQKGERFTLVEAARLPEKPYKPNRIAIVLIGLVLGMGAGIGLASVIEFSDSSFRTPEALAKATGFPVLAEIPDIVIDEDRKKRTLRRIILLSGVIAAIILAVILFDQYVMDLDVLRAKLVRKLS
ncbi:MAG: Wzz/FepE/Etk N-terminal domain-containing protein [Desulfobacteraceae bacterium]|nr:Wzz/FepE/Etk N-terminal domain-containing protein [Desulfobacteraceae bacterium]